MDEKIVEEIEQQVEKTGKAVIVKGKCLYRKVDGFMTRLAKLIIVAWKDPKAGGDADARNK